MKGSNQQQSCEEIHVATLELTKAHLQQATELLKVLELRDGGHGRVGLNIVE